MHKKLVGATFVVSAICLLLACGSRPMPFDKQKWMDSQQEFYVVGNDRYRMMLWLEKNYTFCGKQLDEIMDMFGEGRGESSPGSRRKEILRNGKMVVVTKQHNPNFIIGIDPWVDTDWVEIHVSPNGRVTKAVAVHHERGKKNTERVVCSE